jgi:hypothetical protein
VTVVSAAAALLLAGCSAPAEPQPAAPAPPPAQTAPAVTTPPAPAPPPCTARAADPAGAQRALNGANPGDLICLAGDLGGTRLRISRSGTAAQPVRVLGFPGLVTKGLDVRASFVVVDGLTAIRPAAPGISLLGTDIVLQNSRVDAPQGGDYDALRFWGQRIRILNNTLSNTRNLNHAHADCMQTFATDEDHPASGDIVIQGNRCENIDNNCLIVEGPNSEAGDGSGVGRTRDITWADNYCDNRSDQAVLLDDVRGATLTNNQVVGPVNHAFAIQNGSTGVTVAGNKLRAGIRFEVGMDGSSRPGYQGPTPGGQP